MIIANRTLTFSSLCCALLLVFLFTRFNPFFFWVYRFFPFRSRVVEAAGPRLPQPQFPVNESEYLPGVNHRTHRQELYSLAFKHHQNHLHRSPLKYRFNKYQGINRNSNEENFLRVCYYSIPYGDWPALEPQNVESGLCSHIIIGFARVQNGLLSPASEKDETFYKEVLELKKKDPNLKVMLSVGGASNDKGFPEMCSTLSNREKFAVQSAKYLKHAGFDGLDLDWEFPAWNSPFEERFNFARLLQELYEVYKNPLYNLTISVAVAAPKSIINRSYRVAEMARYVDFVNLMGYDYHSFKWYLPVTGHNSPLFQRADEWKVFATANLNWSANYWIQLGMPREKIVVGVPTYGQTFELYDEKRVDVYSPAIGTGDLGLDGQISYPDVCRFLQNGAQSVMDKDSRVPYAYLKRDWVSYDDEESLEEKAKWIRENGYGGVMVYDLNCDDFNGTCGNSTFPLVKSILRGLNYR